MTNHTIPDDSIDEAGLDFLDSVLVKYRHEDSILDVSELDGFLTAIVSGPDTVMPSRWQPVLWGGSEPRWESGQEWQQFMTLSMQMMNDSAWVLMEHPDEFQALFLEHRVNGKTHTVVENWCFGYMRGVALTDWSSLSDEARAWLDAIALHGLEENFPVLRKLTRKGFQQSVAAIEPAARKLHAYWLARRSPPKANPIARITPKTGRNDPCPCGSGKKHKHCCLH